MKKRPEVVACKATFLGGSIDQMMDKKVLHEIEEYLRTHRETSFILYENYTTHQPIQAEIAEFLNKNRKPGFNQILFEFLEKKALTDSELYKKAGIDRRHFSKMRASGYRPRKKTALSLALAMELDMDELEDLLSAAGYSISYSEDRDLIVKYFVEKGIYDLFQINECLDYFREEVFKI
ncbi:helix-turn-helix transcriptional regulator [Metabacillus sp. KIGAM252]|uniref:Helix-turn-helix transcriptional regulator n=1 Tax=Metabacillus flavus TaxID=2823519 RepID=A0ABS5LAG5_9BACI|nr:helix-turn-helix transcriptional regulator [Metabacillus flavus]MBS2967626.1 helix-turn-helix transcriptional regulator [Metabacillus flavus]